MLYQLSYASPNSFTPDALEAHGGVSKKSGIRRKISTPGTAMQSPENPAVKVDLL
jgi:hypothetical protein